MDWRELLEQAGNLGGRYPPWYLPFFNVAVRVVGILFSVWAVVALYSGIVFTMRPELTAHYRTAGISPGLITIGLAVAVGLIGGALLWVRPYRPDLGDAPFSTGPTVDRTTRRSWWTGGLKE